MWKRIIAAIVLFAGAATPASALTRAEVADLLERLGDESQCAAALPEAQAFFDAPELVAAPNTAKEGVYRLVLRCAWRNDLAAASIDAARRAAAIGANWGSLALIDLGQRYSDSAVVLEGFESLQGKPEQIRELKWRTLWAVIRAANDIDPSGARALSIHERLATENYQPEDGIPDDSLRTAHARLLLRFDQVEMARTRLQGVTSPGEVLEIRVEKVFDPLRADADFETRYDLLRAAETDLQRTQESARAHPRLLASGADVVRALRTLGREEEALVEIDRLIAAAQAPNAADQFDDVEDQLNWILNERGYILYRLNRADEGRAVLDAARQVNEDGVQNVSQNINFATMLQSEGRSAEALRVLEDVGNASPYGDMWVATTRVCAANDLGNTALRDEALAYVREHERDNPAAVARALLCVNDLDGAAALYVRRLADPNLRGAALRALQIYVDDGRSTALVNGRLLEQRLDLVRECPDVQAAVNEVGRIERVSLYPVYWGDL